MYEIVFACTSCGVHLSASAEDAGYEFACPNCATPTSVPAGDILFSCRHCREKVLASSNTVGHTFECPHCQASLVVPEADKQLVIQHRPVAVPAAPPATSNPVISGDEKPSHDAPVTEQEALQHGHFMMTWGNYIAQAGLTEDKKEGDEAK